MLNPVGIGCTPSHTHTITTTLHTTTTTTTPAHSGETEALGKEAAYPALRTPTATDDWGFSTWYYPSTTLVLP